MNKMDLACIIKTISLKINMLHVICKDTKTFFKCHMSNKSTFFVVIANKIFLASIISKLSTAAQLII